MAPPQRVIRLCAFECVSPTFASGFHLDDSFVAI